jgi:TP901 family phage tail tape measure protein
MAKSISVFVLGDASGLSRALASASGQVTAFGSKVEGVGGKMASVGKAMTIGLTLPIVAGAALAVKAFANFEQSLNSFEAVSGATGDQMERVSDLAKKLGNDLTLPGASAADAAEAMTELAKGGLSVEDSMDAAKSTIQLATAAEIENADAATILADALNAFGLKGKDAARVADLLAASANATTATIDDMALALKASSAVAAQLGIPIEHVTTALGLMANAGIKGSDAGTSLKTMLLNLAAPTEKAAAVMEELNFQVFDAAGKMLPLPQIIDNWRIATKGLSDAQEIQAMKTIFGTDAIRAGKTILDSAPGAWDKLTEAVGKQGAAADLAASKSKGVSGAIDAMKSSVETAAIDLGEMLAPAIEKAAGWISDLVGKFNNLDDSTKKIIGIGALVVGSLGPIVYIVGNMAKAISGVGTALRLLSANPAILVAAAVVAIAIAFDQAYKSSETFRAGVDAIVGVVRTMAQFVLEAIADIVDGFGTMVGAFDWIPGVGDNLEGLADSAHSTADGLRDMAAGLDEASGAADGGTPRLQAMQDVIDATGTSMATTQGKTATFASSLSGVLTGAAGTASGALTGATSKVDIFGNALPPAGGKVQGFKGDVDRLTGAINQVPTKHATDITTPGAVDSKNKAEAVDKAVSGIPKSWKTNVLTGGTGAAVGALGGVASAAASIPRSITINVAVVTGQGTGNIPFGASGLKNFRGGLAVVGEGGPELVMLPAGSDVIPNGQSQRMLAGVGGPTALGGGGGGVVVNVNVYGRVTSERDLAISIRDELASLSMLTPSLWGGR